MKKFARLFSQLEATNKTNDKIAALVNYFENTPEQDKIWCLALFTGKRPKRPVKTTWMKQWVMEITNIPEWLFQESYAIVGDLGETISLLLPENKETSDKPLNQWMKEIINLTDKTEPEKKQYVLQAWDGLNAEERLIFNKLIGGSFRIGVSNKMLVNALAFHTKKEPSMLMHSLMGNWSTETAQFEDLIHGKNINSDNSKPYPFCLAYALDSEPEYLGPPEEWLAEYKWDGIRGQIIKRNNEIFIWSRGEELVTDHYPELKDTAQKISQSFVLDGEILAIKDGRILNFNELQKRLNRKILSKKMLEDIPIGFYAYDLLELEGENLRNLPLTERRSRMIPLLTGDNFYFSGELPFNKWDDLIQKRKKAREVNSEGLMLKKRNSVYHSGRKKGDWWKWKVDPLTIDAVMIYAQRGSGRRSGFYTDYTFAVRNGNELVTIAKAYSGLTNKEIEEVSRFVLNNSIEKFGPVRTVKPQLVFEIAFEGIGLSNRHKSGVALRFPRISRWRKDKTVKDIDTIESVKSLIK